MMNNKSIRNQKQLKPLTTLTNISISEDIKPLVDFINFLEKHPSNTNGCIMGIHIREMCAACHLKKDIIIGLVEGLQERNYLTYSFSGDIYNITLK